MPRNPNGEYVLPSVYLAASGQTIRADQHNIPMQDIAQALTGSMARNGSTPMTGNLPMNGNRITGLAAATAASDAVRLDQVTKYNGYLNAVSNLTMAANQIPYATGPAAAAATAITPFARGILAANDAGAVNTALGIPGTIATLGANTFTGDQTVPEGVLHPVVEIGPMAASGETVEFTGIPAWANKFDVIFSQVVRDSSGEISLRVQLGDATRFYTSGYSCYTSAGDFTGGYFIFPLVPGLTPNSGVMSITNCSDRYILSGIGVAVDSCVSVGGSSPVITNPITRIRVTTGSSGATDMSGGEITLRCSA